MTRLSRRPLFAILALIRLGRLHFLLGGVLLHLLGVTIAVYAGAALNLRAALWGQVAITASQLMTHYANDYFDLQADRANKTPTNWSGGSRVLVNGWLRPRLALQLALACAVITCVAILVLSVFIRPGFDTFLLLFVAVGLCWFYSAPPLRLHSSGLGELSVAVAVPLLTPLTGYYLQTGAISLLPLLTVIPLCCLQFAMLLAIEFPDAEGDRQANKRTLVVRIGAPAAARLYAAILLLAYILLPLLVYLGQPLSIALAVGMLSPLAALLLWWMDRGDWHTPSRWNRLGFYSIVLLMATAAAMLGAFLLLIGTG
ncbi:MAG: prenyltransferase [Anaerolineae bacterium]|nr:prenyltransferase [Anaerolineae bacterium]